jgi:hypothetical protein
MAKNRTNKSTFTSIYGNGFVTPAQYLTEAICFLVARQKSIDLPDKFWEDKDWAKFFRRQVTMANKLLKDYDIQAILKALKDWRIKNKIRSLGARFMLDPVIKEYQKEIDHQKAQPLQKTPKGRTDIKPQKRIGSKSIISRLKDLDSERS